MGTICHRRTKNLIRLRNSPTMTRAARQSRLAARTAGRQTAGYLQRKGIVAVIGGHSSPLPRISVGQPSWLLPICT
jgi:hypothetical protein